MKNKVITSFEILIFLIPLCIIILLIKIFFIGHIFTANNADDFLVTLIGGIVLLYFIFMIIKKLKKYRNRVAYSDDLLLISSALIDKANLGIRKIIALFLYFFIICSSTSLYIGFFAVLLSLFTHKNDSIKLCNIAGGAFYGFICIILLLILFSFIFNALLWIIYGFVDNKQEK